MKLPGCTTIGLRLVPPYEPTTPLSDRQFIKFIGDVSLTPSSASIIGAFPVSVATRFARSGPSTKTTSPPSAFISAITSSRRTTFTVLNPSDFAIATVARPTPEICAALDDPRSARQFHDVGQQEVGGRRIDTHHGELVDVAWRQWPQPRCVGFDALGPGGMQERHQRSVAFLQMFDSRAHCDNAASSFRAHDGRQPWPIAIAAGDHQKIVLIDRRGLDCDYHFADRWRADVENINEFGGLARIAERLDLDCSHGCSPFFRSVPFLKLKHSGWQLPAFVPALLPLRPLPRSENFRTRSREGRTQSRSYSDHLP